MANINSLVLDSGPLLTQTFGDIHGLADKFFTTPSVHAEIRDEKARQNLLLWGDRLVIRQPKPESVRVVSEFSKKTGDYPVLSSTDMQILALAYEVECELNGGDWRLKRVPGQKVINGRLGALKNEPASAQDEPVKEEPEADPVKEEPTEPVKEEALEELKDEPANGEDEWSVVTNKKKNKYNKKKNTKKSPKKEPKQEPKQESKTEEHGEITVEVIEHDEDDTDGWITNENLEETIEKEEGDRTEKEVVKKIKAAMSTGDFAMQNVALQMGLNLVNPTNGKSIKKIKNYMLRCHACFKLCPLPRDGRPLQFCPKCGLDTLMRCTVSVTDTGKIQVHLKKNMQWSHRGDRYSLPTPQSKNARRQRHEQNPVLLREDQKEYQKAVKDDQWKRKHNEKLLDEWIGTGSAESVMSPFAISGYKRDATRHTGVRVGRGRYVNTARKPRK
ncbi:20S-pre-rRNA D-site endonuclease Nob1p [Trichomonascus vanleenenianus]|uniref:rRNA-binding endoribonuclease n=1 Tax=Trichomonascus vanleenenianus TaxID=2268995 RepID=UPI003ECA66BA